MNQYISITPTPNLLVAVVVNMYILLQIGNWYHFSQIILALIHKYCKLTTAHFILQPEYHKLYVYNCIIRNIVHVIYSRIVLILLNVILY